MNPCTAAVLTLVFATSLFAQTDSATPEPVRKLRLITEAQTQGYLAKFDTGGTTTTNSVLYELNGRIGLGTTNPLAALQIYGDATSDVTLSLGVDPTGATGPAMNLGYGGSTFGRGNGFLNVRPDAAATAANANNPSLRFMTSNTERMILTNTGRVGIGTPSSGPTQRLHLFSSENESTVLLVENADANGTAAAAALRTSSAVAATSYVSHGNRAGTISRFGMTLDGWNEIVSFIGNGQILGTSNDRPVVFGTNNAERLRIHSNGKISIGTTAATDARLYLQHIATIAATGAQSDTGMHVVEGNAVPAGMTNSGGVIGGRMDAWNYGPGVMAFATGGYFRAGSVAGPTPGPVTYALALQAEVRADGGPVTNGYGLYVQDIHATNDYGIYQYAANDSNYFAGNVVIGTVPNQAVTMLEVKGNAHFSGVVTGTNIRAQYQDVAEWVPATTDLAPGTVVILNRERNNEVMASRTSYDTTVAGVVSAQPGLSLGIEGEGKEQIATTGRVKVFVDARVNPVRVGDLLVTSDVPGTAMRSEPMDINGRQFHQPGTIIGKALEPLAGQVGEILVLLSMQ